VRAVLYERPREFAVESVPLPEPPPGAARIRLTATGVCGTDVHIHDGDFFARFPLIPGHEPAGVVEALGEGVEDLQVGQRVAVNGNSGCGRCRFCATGDPLLCRDLSALGVTGPGGFAECMLAPAGQCLAVDELEPDVAVMVEPTACAVHGLDVLDVRPGSDVLVFGAGPTGLMLSQLLMHSGAARVTVAAPSAFKLDLAKSYGVDETVQLDRQDAEVGAARLRELAPDGYDAVVDATGAVAVSERCIALTKDGGTVLFYGVTRPTDQISVSPYEIYRRELTIKGSFAQVNSFPRAIEYLRNGRVKTGGLITHRFGLDGFGAALDAVRSDPTCHKAIIEP
jgi:D-arabinitol dehydrogenase (NADP+)